MAWRFAIAQSTGAQHTISGAPCQDSAACFADADGLLIIAVSDGAGSAAHADVGSALAVSTAVAFLQAHARRPDLARTDVLKAAARSAQGALVTEAARSGATLQSYACTLLLLALTPDSGGALQVGDGVMVLRSAEQPWQQVFWPQKGEFVNTTRFLTDVDAEQIWEVAQVPADISDAAVMTDGLETLALQFAGKTVHAGFFDGVMRPLWAVDAVGESPDVAAMLNSFLRSPRVTERADDDLTLVVASRRTPA